MPRYLPKKVFYSTKDVIEAIYGKKLTLIFKNCLQPGIDIKTGIIFLPIYQPTKSKTLYTMLEHELAHILFKSKLPKLKNIESFKKEIIRIIFNIIEDERVESLWSKIYRGSEIEFNKLKEKYRNNEMWRQNLKILLNQGNPIGPLLAIRFGVKLSALENIPQEWIDEAQYCINNVRGKSVKVAFILTKRYYNKICKPWIEKLNKLYKYDEYYKKINKIRNELERQKRIWKIDTKNTLIKEDLDKIKKEINIVKKEAEEFVNRKLKEIRDEKEKIKEELNKLIKDKKDDEAKEKKEKLNELENEEKSLKDKLKKSIEVVDEEIESIEKEIDDVEKTFGKSIDDVEKEIKNELDKVKNIKFPLPPLSEEIPEAEIDFNELPDEIDDKELKNIENEVIDELEKIREKLDKLQRKKDKFNIQEYHREVSGPIIKEKIDPIFINPNINVLDEYHKLRKFFEKIQGQIREGLDEEGFEVDVEEYIQYKIRKEGRPFIQDREHRGLAIAIGIDLSGSMWGKLEIAKVILLTLYKALHGIKDIELNIYGWTAKTNEYKLYVYEIKSEEDIKGLTTGGNTPTNLAIEYGLDILKKSNKIKKLLIIITDGIPEVSTIPNSLLINLSINATYRTLKNGISILGIGIMCDEFLMNKIFFGRYISVKNMEEAGKILLNHLTRLIQRHLIYGK